MSTFHGNSNSFIVKKGLILSLDAGNKSSYTSGTAWNDLSGNGYNGTLTNGPTYNTASGGSISFDGSNDCVTFSSSNLITASLSLNNASMEVWFMQTTASSNAQIFYAGNPGSSGFGFYIGPCGTESNRLGLVHGGITCYRVSYLGIVANTWYHCAYVKNGTNNFLYINGVLQSTGSGNYTAPVATVSMGLNQFTSTEAFAGRISLARLYNYSLTQYDVLQNYNASKSRFTGSTTYSVVPKMTLSNLAVYFDAANRKSYPSTGTSWFDLSGNSRTGTITNGPTFDSTNGGSIVFDGTNDYVDILSLLQYFGTSTFSVSMWLNVTSFANTGTIACALTNGKYTVFGPTNNYQGYSNTFSAAIQIDATSNAVGTVMESGFSTGKWYHYTAVYDGTKTGNANRLKVYINGIQKGLIFDNTVPATGGTTNSTVLLGFQTTLNVYRWYSGKIGLCQIYTRALTNSEVLQNCNATKGRYGV